MPRVSSAVTAIVKGAEGIEVSSSRRDHRCHRSGDVAVSYHLPTRVVSHCYHGDIATTNDTHSLSAISPSLLIFAYMSVHTYGANSQSGPESTNERGIE